MSVRLSHTLCMEREVTVQHVMKWRSMYCVDMFPKTKLQGVALKYFTFRGLPPTFELFQLEISGLYGETRQ